MFWFLLLLLVAVLTFGAIALDVLDARSAGRGGALLGLITVGFLVGISLMSFSSWDPPHWARVVGILVPLLTWPASLATSIIGWRRGQRIAIVGLACCLAVAVAFIVMLNVAY